MFELLLAATVFAEVAAGTGPAQSSGNPDVVVEGRRSARSWELPDLEYDESGTCPALVETEIPGFGVMRVRKRCASDGTEQWRLFQF